MSINKKSTRIRLTRLRVLFILFLGKLFHFSIGQFSAIVHNLHIDLFLREIGRA